MYDLPDGSWDMDREETDHEQAELYARGRRAAALKRKGVCVHGGGGPVDLPGLRAGTDTRYRCTECGAIFATADEMYREHARLLA